jgi:hypothetical protein
MKRYNRFSSIHCILTNRSVRLGKEIVEIYALGSSAPVATQEGKRWCEDTDLDRCPHDCIYISGGRGGGRDPATGSHV